MYSTEKSKEYVYVRDIQPRISTWGSGWHNHNALEPEFLLPQALVLR